MFKMKQKTLQKRDSKYEIARDDARGDVSNLL